MDNTQKEIIESLNVVEDQTDIASIVRERVDFIKNQLVTSKQRSFVLGISGGVDSLTAGLMAQQAVNELNNDGYVCKFIAMKLPFAIQSDEQFVELALSHINPSETRIVNIQSIVEQIEQWLDDPLSKHDLSKKDFIRGNIKARSRMIVQYTMANSENGLVIGTDHAAEAVTGFFTKHGDGACDIAPLFGLVKRTVRNIAKYYDAPEELYEKVATADLEDLRVNLSDEDALGLSYDDIDAFLLGEKVSTDVYEKIVERYKNTEHKRQSPTVPYYDSKDTEIENEDVSINECKLVYSIDVSDMKNPAIKKFIKGLNKHCKDNGINIEKAVYDKTHLLMLLEDLQIHKSDKEYYDVIDFIDWITDLNNDSNFSCIVKYKKLQGFQFGEAIHCSMDEYGMIEAIHYGEVYKKEFFDRPFVSNTIYNLLQPMRFQKA